jgi:predicted glycosyltransferase involved in capsule biosynthesis
MVKHKISLIVTFKPDTDERIKNLELFKDYYTRIMPNSEIIVQETTDDIFNKCKLYNAGVKKAKYNTICFIDSDIFVSEKSIEIAYKQSQLTENIVIGYSGDVVNMSYKFKEKIKEGFVYDDLVRDIKPFNSFKLYESTDMYQIVHTQSVGGCLMMTRDCFEDINGFNPNFRNWGYEDDEILARASGLGKNILRLNKSQDTILIHLPHLDSDKHYDVPRDKHAHYNHNRDIYFRVKSMKKDELQSYIATWKV